MDAPEFDPPRSRTEIEGVRDQLVEIRHDIHRHPELAYEETRTADVVARELEACGLDAHRGLGGTGVVATLKCGNSNRAIALRADMDALPLQEFNDFDHKSRHDGVMHACGHDGHTAMLLGAARYLSDNRDFNGTVHFIFQPAEEGKAGAKKMIDDGLFELFPVEMVFGMHNMPERPTGKFFLRPGPIMAAAEFFDVTITGKGGHAAMPNQAVDPVVIAAEFVNALQTVISRKTDPMQSAVVGITMFNSGTAHNIIPESAALGGTIRSFEVDLQEEIRASIRRLGEGICGAHGAEFAVRFHPGYPPTVNSADETALAAKAAARVVGADNVVNNCDPVMGAEDFAFMLLEKPGCYVHLGNGPGDGGCTLHNPHYDFNDEILAIGASYWVELVNTVLGDGA